MVWWLIPLAAFVLAVVWVTWVNRPRPPADPHDTLREHERFKRAMERRTRRPDDGGPARPDAGPDAPRDPGEA